MPSSYIPGLQCNPLRWFAWNPNDEFLSAMSICGCCNLGDALEAETPTPVWKCQASERRWHLYPAEEMGAACIRANAHPASVCPGNCSLHPLMRPEFRLHFSSTFLDFVERCEEEDRARESPEARRRREAEEASRLLELELSGAAAVRESYARDQHEQARRGKTRKEEAKLILQPCKWMYEEVVDPRTGKAMPTKFNPKMECWAWRYTDPKTKRMVEPCTCMRLHPGQAQWAPEWEKMTYSRALTDAKARHQPQPVAAAPRFASLQSPQRGGAWVKPAPGAPKKPAVAASRFGAIDSSDEDVSAW